MLDDPTNPFLDDFYAGRAGAAFQSQLFFTLNRHRQQLTLRQGDLFSQTIVCDYLFDRDRIYAFLNLDDNELYIYQRLFDLLSRDVPVPDLVVFLQAKADTLRARLRERAARADEPIASEPTTHTSSSSPRPTTISSFTTRPRPCSWSKRRIWI